jgi:hypothetical protein
MNGFKTIPHIGEGPTDNDAHGVVHIGLFHLIFDVDRDVFLKNAHGGS